MPPAHTPERAPALDAISASTVDQVELLDTFSGHRGRVHTVAFSGDGAYVASASMDKTIKLWDVMSGPEVYALSMNEECKNGITFPPDGRLLASASVIWGVESKQVVHSLERSRQLPGPVAFSADGSVLAAALVNQSIKLWDVASGRQVRSLPHGDEVMSVAFSPGGTLLVSGGYDNQVYLWGVSR